MHQWHVHGGLQQHHAPSAWLPAPRAVCWAAARLHGAGTAVPPSDAAALSHSGPVTACRHFNIGEGISSEDVAKILAKSKPLIE